MREEQQQRGLQRWRLKVRLRAKSFDFKFGFKQVPPSFKFHSLSVLLRLRDSSFHIESQSDSVSLFKKPKIESKIKSFLRSLAGFKLKTPHAKCWELSATTNSRKLKSQEAVRAGSLCAVPFLFLSYFISEKDPLEAIAHGAAAIFCAIVYFLAKQKTMRRSETLVALIVGSVVCCLALLLEKNLRFFRSKFFSDLSSAFG